MWETGLSGTMNVVRASLSVSLEPGKTIMSFQMLLPALSAGLTHQMPAPAGAADPVKALIHRYRMALRKRNLTFSKVDFAEGDIWQVLCTNSLGLPATGYGDEIGEATPIRIFETSGARIRLSRQWKGGKVSPDGRSWWPDSEPVYMEILSRIAFASVTAVNWLQLS